MPIGYSEGQRALQDRFDARRLADRIDQRLVRDFFDESDRELIEKVEMFFLATADRQGRPSCSYKGGDPGFVRVLDEKTLAFPVWDGNGMFVSAGNVLENPNVGLLFVDLARGGRLRVEGEASLDDGPLKAAWPEAQMAMKVRVRVVYPNCGRYVHRYKLEERSRFVPREGCETPQPGWKKSDWAHDVLPEKK